MRRGVTCGLAIAIVCGSALWSQTSDGRITVRGKACIEKSDQCPSGTAVTFKYSLDGETGGAITRGKGIFEFQQRLRPSDEKVLLTAEAMFGQPPRKYTAKVDVETKDISQDVALYEPEIPLSGPVPSPPRRQTSEVYLPLQEVTAVEWGIRNWSEEERQQAAIAPTRVQVLDRDGRVVEAFDTASIDLDKLVLLTAPGHLGRAFLFDRSEGQIAMYDIGRPDLGWKPLADVVLEPVDRYAAWDPSPARQTRSARGSTYGPSMLQGLPLPLIRSIDAFALLEPGVVPSPESWGRRGPGIAAGIGTVGQFSANGMRSRENNFTIDGADNNDEDTGVRRQGFLLPLAQSIEGLEAMEITTANADARFGRVTGAHVNLMTRLPVTQWHGMVNGFFSNDVFNARDYFERDARGPRLLPLTANGLGTGRQVEIETAGVAFPGLREERALAFVEAARGGKGSMTRGSAGISAGGPAGKLGDFLFFSFEHARLQSNQMHRFAVPTLAQRGIANSGGFGFRAEDVLRNPVPLETYPATLPGNAVFSLYPFPNDPGGAFGANNYTTGIPARGHGSLGSVKWDKRVGDTSAFVRYLVSDEAVDTTAIGGALDSSIRPATNTQNIIGTAETNLRRGLINHFRVAFGRSRTDFEARPSGRLTASRFPSESGFLLNAPLLMDLSLRSLGPLLASAASAIGQRQLSRLNIPDAQNFHSVEDDIGPIGELRIAGYSSIGIPSFYFPQNRNQRTWQFTDHVSRAGHRMTWSAGVDVRTLDLLTDQRRNERPLLEYHGLRTANFLQRDTYLSALELAAGAAPAGLRQTFSATDDASLRLQRTVVDSFLQTEIRPAARLKLSLGLRVIVNRQPGSLDERLTLAYSPAQFQPEVERAQSACPVEPAVLNARCLSVIASAVQQISTTLDRKYGSGTVGWDPRAGIVLDLTGRGRLLMRAAGGLYSAQFPAIVMNESRSTFPSFAPVNLSVPAAWNTALSPALLYNFARVANAGNRQPGTLGTIPADSRTTPNLLALISNQLTLTVPVGLPSGGLEVVQFPGQNPIVQLTLPADKLRNAYAWHTSFGLEQRFGKASGASVGYVGTGGRRLLRPWAPQGGIYRTDAVYNGTLPLNGVYPNYLVELRQSGVNVRQLNLRNTVLEGTGNSNYHSLQSDIWISKADRFFLRSHFVWSHSIDDVSDFFDVAGATAHAANSASRSERADSSFDVRLRSVSYGGWDIRNKSGRKWFGLIQLTGILNAQTGAPYTVNSTIDWNADGILSDRPQNSGGLLAGPQDGDRRTRLALAPGTTLATLMPDQKAANRVVYLAGAVGRNTYRADGILTTDVASTVTLWRAESRSVVVRAEAFNLFNRPHFAVPVRWLDAPGFGTSTSTSVPNRQIQFSVRFNF